MKAIINKKPYYVCEDEFNKIDHKEYQNLRILNNVGKYEKLISFINTLSNINLDDIIFYSPTHGGFIPIHCSSSFPTVYLTNIDEKHIENIRLNCESHNISNIIISDKIQNTDNCIIFSESINDNIKYSSSNILISPYNKNIIASKTFDHMYSLKDTDLYIYLNNENNERFKQVFQYYLDESNNVLDYNNLINMCIMVKNAGPQFEQMLIKNLPIIDRWTILDTGSTDETIEIINRVLVGKKNGKLYQEPFINFRDSRNRLLDLAGTYCKYNIMLDDTYTVEGNLREFLTEIRGDQYANSFTLFIHSDDTKYGSNRITISNFGLRYIYKIHEVISDKDNINIVIPENRAYINDGRFDYMEKRTQERKQLDLKLLYEEVEDNPNDPRAYYYLAQTYNLLENYENAYKYFLKRAEFTNSGFIQERVDSLFEAARVANFKLNLPWSVCKDLYERCFKVDESRPEALYFIGIHYYLENDYKTAFPYLKRGFEIGFPQHCQYSLKPTLSFHFLPKFLTRMCYSLEEYILGEKASLFFLQNNSTSAEDYQEILSWHNIFTKLNMYQGPKQITNINNTNGKPYFVFVADGGFNQWTGSTLLKQGVGGSETYIIEMARWIQKSGKFQTIVFCNTPDGQNEDFEGTIYKPLSQYAEFVNTHYVDTCIVSRFSEYLPVAFKGFVENVYLVVHDLTPSGIVIPMDVKLKNIFCLTEWHVYYLTQIFPQLASICAPFYYGINQKFLIENAANYKVVKRFIYSSFPNRGLLQLLQMWPKIYEKFPACSLDIFSDVNNKWSNDVEPKKMELIKYLLEKYSKMPNGLGINYKGWVSKQELSEGWKQADIWFYPCTFMETFCLTALEAAASKTFVITNDLAALQNTVGNRGCVIDGDATTKEWQEKTLEKIFYYLSKTEEAEAEKQDLINTNFQWAQSISWESQATRLLNQYILPNSKYEYKGEYYLYKEPKIIFENVMFYYNKNNNIKQILDIGTYNGILLIELVKQLNNCKGIGIDNWNDNLYLENSFNNNVNSANLREQIVGIKCNNINDKLFYYLDSKYYFDIIHINKIDSEIELYSYLFICWNLLLKNGLLIVNYYNNLTKQNIVNKFLDLYKNNYNIIYAGNRLFINKK